MARVITPPFFEIGPKNYLSRDDLLEVAAAAAAAAAAYDVSVIITAPTLDLEVTKQSEPKLWVFAQAMDLDHPGPSTGAVLPEALAQVGADGVLINHPEHPLPADDIAVGIERARRCGLASMVWADGETEACALTRYGPDIVLVEPRRLIGTATSGNRPWIRHVNEALAAVDSRSLVMHAGGIGTPADVRYVMGQGAHGTGSTSAVVFADDRPATVHNLIRAVREGWDEQLVSSCRWTHGPTD